MVFAQPSTATDGQILTVLIGGAAIVGIVYLILGALNQWREFKSGKSTVNVQAVNTELVTVVKHEKDISALQNEIRSVRADTFAVVDRIMAKLDEMKTDLKLDGSRRSKTLFDHIDKGNSEIFRRLNEQDKSIARLEERTHG